MEQIQTDHASQVSLWDEESQESESEEPFVLFSNTLPIFLFAEPRKNEESFGIRPTNNSKVVWLEYC